MKFQISCVHTSVMCAKYRLQSLRPETSCVAGQGESNVKLLRNSKGAKQRKSMPANNMCLKLSLVLKMYKYQFERT